MSTTSGARVVSEQDDSIPMEHIPSSSSHEEPSPETHPLTSSPEVEDPKPKAAKQNVRRSSSREWRALSLQYPFLSLCVGMEIAVIAIILVLNAISLKRNGIATIDKDQFLPGHSFISKAIGGEALLWTSLPNFVMTIYRLMWDAIVSSSAERQPFVELRKSKGQAASAQVTILLDYKSMPSFKSWAIAFYNGHYLISCGIVLNLILSIAVVPLTAHLFDAATTTSNSTLSLASTTFYNETGFTGLSDVRPAIDVASATNIYGGSSPPWTTLEYAFPPFTSTGSIGQGNITANTTAYSAYLECVSVPDSDYNASYSSGDKTVSVTAGDRGCSFTQSIVLSNTTSIYAASWAVSDCSFTAGYSRIGVLSGQYDASSPLQLSNFSVISCIPSYWTTPGNVTVSDESSNLGVVSAFTQQGNASSFRPLLWRPFENNLHEISVFDPTDTYQTDDFSRVVYTLSAKLNPSSPLNDTSLVNAFERVFTTVYAMTANTLLFQQAVAATNFQGILTVAVNRLYVVSPIAYTVVAAMFAILICNILLFMYAYKKKSILLEEPVGLLGHAALLDQSELLNIVHSARAKDHSGGQLVKFMKKHYNLHDTKCYFDGPTSLDGRLIVEGLHEE